MSLFSRRMLVSLLLAACACTACGYVRNDPGSVMAADWQVLFDKTADPETASRSGGWRPVAIPSKFKLPYKPKRDYQYAWLKATLNVPGDPSAFNGIHLGRVYYLDQVYVNGRLIGEHAAGDPISMHFPRNYTLPEHALVKGSNTLLVRLGVYGRKYGGITDPVLLLTDNAFKRIRGFDEFIYHHCPLAIAIAMLFQIVFFIIYFAWSKSTEMFLVIIYYTLGFLLLIYDMFGTGLFGHDVRLTLKDAILTTFPIIFIFIIQSFYRVYIPVFNMCMGAYLVTALAVTFASFDTTSPYYLAEIFSNGTMMLAVPAGFITLVYSQTVRPDRIKLILFLLLTVLPSGLVLGEVVAHYFMKGFAEYTGIGFFIIYMIAFISLLSRNIIRREIKLRVLYHDLKKQTSLTAKKSSPEPDDRIDAVIGFIKINFMSDLSREGLAASAGVSADYLSKKFNAATGKRIDEFINELRVGAAAEMLRETDRKIIDIAFLVGFESLSTFNRIFLKQTGFSPKYFRQKARERTA